MFVEYRRSGDERIRNRIVEGHLHLADHATRRYRDHALREDLHQVALMALVHAAQRFDPDVGASFRTFAARTIDGNCKRYLRDRSWKVRPPRGVLELALTVRRQQEELGHVLGRPPTVDELADQLDTTAERILEAIEAYGSRRGVSIQDHRPDEPVSPSVERACSNVERGYAAVEDRAAVRPALARLPVRERELLFLRFIERRSQSELAEHFGFSQSYVSRFLNTTLQQLRRDVGLC
jgi:RNA polymerase sigma-B factor